MLRLLRWTGTNRGAHSRERESSRGVARRGTRRGRSTRRRAHQGKRSRTIGDHRERVRLPSMAAWISGAAGVRSRRCSSSDPENALHARSLGEGSKEGDTWGGAHGMGTGRGACLLYLEMKGVVGSFYRGVRPWTERGELQRGVAGEGRHGWGVGLHTLSRASARGFNRGAPWEENGAGCAPCWRHGKGSRGAARGEEGAGSLELELRRCHGRCCCRVP
jgi:hypothetical protein